MIDVRDCLKKAIEYSGLKQMAIAERAGLTDQMLSDIVNKRRKLDANEFITVCKIINTTPNEILAFGVEKQESA